MSEFAKSTEPGTSVDEPILQLQKLTKSHNRPGFDCGYSSLNVFLKTVAREAAQKGKSVTYVATYDGYNIVGYYTLVLETLELQGNLFPPPLTTKLSVTAMLLGKLAVIESCRGKKIGEQLLYNAMYDCQIIADKNGADVLLVDALKESNSPSFYRRYGFEKLPIPETPQTVPMYRTIRSIRELNLHYPKA